MTSELNLQKGLVGHWTLDDADTSGGTIYDSSASDSHGTMSGSISTGSTGKVSEAFTFDGSDDDIRVTDSSKFRTSEFSVTLWFRGTSQTSWTVQLGKAYWDNNKGFIVYSGTDSGNIGVTGPQFSEVATSNTYYDGNYHFVGVTYDGSNFTVNLDGGDEVVTGARSFTHSTLDHIIGTRHNNNGSSLNDGNRFNGEIDDVRWYDRALSESEISALYNMREQRTANL